MKIQNILVSLSIVFTVQLGLGHPQDSDSVISIPLKSSIKPPEKGINFLPPNDVMSNDVYVGNRTYYCDLRAKEASLEDRLIERRDIKLKLTPYKDENDRDKAYLVKTSEFYAFTFRVEDTTISEIYCYLGSTTDTPDETNSLEHGTIGLMRELLRKAFGIELNIAPPIKASLEGTYNAG